jgi:hypothetical protein
MRHVPSSDVDRRRCSQPCRGLKVIAVTEEVWPLNTEIGTPSGNLQIRIEQSFEAEATSVFPLLTAMSVISPSWPRQLRKQSPVSEDQIFTSRSSEPVMTYCPVRSKIAAQKNG